MTHRPTIKLSIAPVPKPRMTQSDRWKKRPAVVRYHQFKDDLRKEVKGTLEGCFEVVFHLPMSKSWSAKERARLNGKPHQNKPDIDNLLKALMDALCKEDQHVYDVHVKKLWAETGYIEITERI